LYIATLPTQNFILPLIHCGDIKPRIQKMHRSSDKEKLILHQYTGTFD